MHKDEMWQVYAPNGEPIEGKGWDSALDNPEVSGADEIVGVAVVFLYRRGESGVELLWQKRADNIDRYPGYYDISAGGHINLGETVVEGAIRETAEEIGAVITANFMVDWTGKSDEFHFDDKEVSEVKWVPFVEMEEFRKKYAKPPLAKDDLVFENLRDWLIMHGEV